METTNILILGGAGFLGSNLVRRCLGESKVKITVLDSLEPRLRSSTDNLQEVWSQIEFIQGDIRHSDLMNEVVQGQDIIFNCAAQTSHPISLQDPLFDAEVNCLGNLVLLEALRQHNREAVVVYASSSTAVGRTRGEIIDETHMERPLDIYSANKGVAEKYYLIYHAVHDIKAIVFRFANLYGPYGKGWPEFGFVNYFIHLAHRDQPITVYGDGAQRRNVMYVEDATDILYDSAFNKKLIGKLFFAAHHEEHLSVLEVARKITAVFGRGQVVNVDWPEMRRRIEVNHVLISSARLEELTGWRPKYSLASGLAQTKAIMVKEEDWS
jgi:UDP-glucose 4-epimerase